MFQKKLSRIKFLRKRQIHSRNIFKVFILRHLLIDKKKIIFDQKIPSHLLHYQIFYVNFN